MGLIADEQPAMYKVLEAAGLTHGKGMQSYLCMMAVRLLEMRRVLKDSGSIYLHCDPTAGHYLKLLMDSIWGQSNFRNEIVWKRTSGRSDANGYGRVHDTILFYCRVRLSLGILSGCPIPKNTSEGHIATKMSEDCGSRTNSPPAAFALANRGSLGVALTPVRLETIGELPHREA